ncbi:MAG: hypothetical protein J5737_01435 [Bacteroidales bacterium]|nr:hypothetical protein [Bacteroidales bacterium]
MRLFTLTSDLHGELARSAHNEPFIKDIEAALGEPFEYMETDYSSFGRPGDVIYVRTGGTEGQFLKVYAGHGETPVRLLTSGQSNSLAASMEILSWLRDRNIPGEILHGSPEQIASLLHGGATEDGGERFCRPFRMPGALRGKRYGVVGRPSDWLISSAVDYESARRLLGAELIDIPIEELVELVRSGVHADCPSLKPLNAPRYGRPISQEDFSGALAIYSALKAIVAKYGLDGLTLRCFDLLTALGNTGCMALALLNSEGLVATCEGDVPAMLSMALVRQKYGKSGFQTNLSRIEGSSYLFAHCTVPLDMVEDYCYDTHFESGIGVAVHGLLPEGPARIFKLSAGLDKCFDEPVRLAGNPYGANLCRTQVLVQAPLELRDYFLGRPLGNHHIIVPR